MAQFKILGPLAVTSGGRVCTPTAPRVRTVLALLLLQSGRVVPVSTMIGELWGDQPAKSALTTVQTYIYHLRKLFARERLETPERRLLISHPNGYELRLPPDALDLDVFGRLVDEGRRELNAGRPDRAAGPLHRALGLWTGPALTNVTTGPLVQMHLLQLEEQRIRALELRIQSDLELGRHRELTGELRLLVGTHPLNEWFHRQLIVVLDRCGRRADALRAYQQVRRLLNDELGIDPSAELQRLHRQVLAGTAPSWPSRRAADLASVR
ncbi:AfsR/SARP family transcriptional regulator [Jidongwangia harbinensis]|uniref:AfsR/SARP family transcriptional regulator n=1 Tax=Jidongwangia harbinensis TaxID=2878561 RepID=UPI001CD99DED|nr:AfsR/SARP family transcriptional regulator [Jidongwangia harbinensis]MCA2219202.1 AfsR/SARP family transcriptional regulator [Jidongwangia harbinensis]